jgi:hypothetical protein
VKVDVEPGSTSEKRLRARSYGTLARRMWRPPIRPSPTRREWRCSTSDQRSFDQALPPGGCGGRPALRAGDFGPSTLRDELVDPERALVSAEATALAQQLLHLDDTSSGIDGLLASNETATPAQNHRGY